MPTTPLGAGDLVEILAIYSDVPLLGGLSGIVGAVTDDLASVAIIDARLRRATGWVILPVAELRLLRKHSEPGQTFPESPHLDAALGWSGSKPRYARSPKRA